MNDKNSIVKMKTTHISLKTFLNNPDQVFNEIKEFEALHKYCHGTWPRSGDLVYPYTTPLMCEYFINFADGYNKNVMTLNCAIHEDDYIPTVFALFLFKKMPCDDTITELTGMFNEHIVHIFMDKGPSMMDLKKYIQSHVNLDKSAGFINYYHYLKNKYYGGKHNET